MVSVDDDFLVAFCCGNDDVPMSFGVHRPLPGESPVKVLVPSDFHRNRGTPRRSASSSRALRSSAPNGMPVAMRSWYTCAVRSPGSRTSSTPGRVGDDFMTSHIESTPCLKACTSANAAMSTAMMTCPVLLGVLESLV